MIEEEDIEADGNEGFDTADWIDTCVECGWEHGYMTGPCELCGGTTFQEKK